MIIPSLPGRRSCTQFIVCGLVAIGLVAQTVYGADDSRVGDLQKQLKQSQKAVKALTGRIDRLEKGAGAASSDDSLDRLDDLEDVVQDMDERVGSRALAHAFDGMKLDIGGFVHSAFTHIDGEDDSANSFDRQNFELLIKAELNKEWSVFFAGGFLRESDNPFALGSRTEPVFNSRNKTPQIIAWTNYQGDDSFNLRIGRFITPHGIINIEHFPATLLDPEQPQFLRPFGGDTLFPNFSTGLQLHDRLFLGQNLENTFEYAVYVSSFAGAPEDEIYGGRGAYTIGNSNLTIGGNVASGRRANESNYDLLGIDLFYDGDEVFWKTEFFTTSEDVGGDRSGGYTQPALRLNDQWIAFYRYDFLDDGGSETVENALGVNYLPYSNVRLRGILRLIEFDDGTVSGTSTTVDSADATVIQISGTFSF